MANAVLIADIGGTSSRWAVLRPDAAPQVVTGMPGFNPATGAPDVLLDALRAGTIAGTVTNKVVVYGAGCGTAGRQQRMQEALGSVFAKADIHVHSDLLGAARSAWGTRSGLIMILGTGMNVGYYDGTDVRCPMPSLGFILGDEGSGADLGKHVLRDLFQGTLPRAVQDVVFPSVPELGDVIERLHRGSAPQAWLASFTAGLARAVEDPYVIELVSERFNELAILIERFFLEVERRDVQAIGSVAFGFQDLLGPALTRHGMRLTAVAQDPMVGLVAYHQGAPA